MRSSGSWENWTNWNPGTPEPEARAVPYFELKKGELNFPPAHFADLDGLLAVGGEMTAESLLLAYQSGLYYWHHPMKHVKWWSPDPRIVLETQTAPHPECEMQEGFEIATSADLQALLRRCQQHYNREGDMTPAWLSERMYRIFVELGERGLVHAQEVRKEGQLVGGFFGVCLGNLCFGEYAVETVPGAAACAILGAARELGARGVHLMDMQKQTARAGQLPYDEVSRVAFVDLCRVAAEAYRRNLNQDPL